MAKKGSNGGGASKIYDPAKEAAARKAAQQRKKHAAGHSEVHNIPGLNRGLGAIAKREKERKLRLAGVRANQADEAMEMMPDLLPSEFSSAHEVFAAIVAQFRIAEARKGSNGRQMSATEVAVEKARLDNRHLFSAPMAEDGVQAAKKALWRAGTPNWAMIEKGQQEERERREKRRQREQRQLNPTPAKPAVSAKELKKLQDAVTEANLNANLARAGMTRLSRKTAEASLLAAKKALASATAA